MGAGATVSREGPGRRHWQRILAYLLAGAIFAIDSVAGFDVSVAILYTLALALVGSMAEEREIYVATAGCMLLAAISWIVVHGGAPDLASGLRLVFAFTAIGLTCALLVGRKRFQRVRAELEASRADLQNFADSVPQLLWRTRADGQVDYFNRRYADLTGHDHREAIEKQNWIEWFHPEDAPAAQALFADIFPGEKGNELRLRFRMLHADGSYRWMSLMGRAVRDQRTGQVTAWYGGTLDAHDEALAQEALRQLNDTLEQRVEARTTELLASQDRLSTLFAISSITYAEQDLGEALDILAELKRQGVTDLRAHFAAHPELLDRCIAAIRIVHVNDALARLLGYDDVADLVATPPEGNAEDGRAVLLRQLEMAFYGTDRIEGRTVLVGKHGQRYPIFYVVHRLADERQLSSHIDISSQERIEEMRLAAQEELARANRVATVGAFSASIAHELNQPIASMAMDVQTGIRLLRRETPDIDKAVGILERLVRTTDRVASIVQHTRDQITRGQRAAVPVDLCELVRDTLELLAREIRNSGTRVTLDCASGASVVRGDRVDLQQVLVNLLTNAMDALSATEEGAREIVLTIASDGGSVRLVASDTGPGLPEDLLQKLFEPFFTTKPGGVGMGLQICRTTVEAFGGSLVARNRPEGGAQFECTLPADRDEAETAVAR